MSYVHAMTNTYYMVSKELYERCKQDKQNVDDKLSEYPKRFAKRIKAVLVSLSTSGLRWDVLGNVQGNSAEFPTSWNVLQLTSYCIQPKGPVPNFLDSFINLLLQTKVQEDLLSPKIRKKIAKRKKELEK